MIFSESMIISIATISFGVVALGLGMLERKVKRLEDRMESEHLREIAQNVYEMNIKAINVTLTHIETQLGEIKHGLQDKDNRPPR